jgi:hypothetical protein
MDRAEFVNVHSDITEIGSEKNRKCWIFSKRVWDILKVEFFVMVKQKGYLESQNVHCSMEILEEFMSRAKHKWIVVFRKIIAEEAKRKDGRGIGCFV